MKVAKNQIFKSLILTFVLIIYVTNVKGQSSINHDVLSKTSLTHCQTIDKIWSFARPWKKRHAVLTIFGLNVNDTLSIKVGDKTLLDCRVYNISDKMHLAGINRLMEECFFLVYYSNNKIKHIYNSRNCSESCFFERGKSKNESSKILMTYNGEIYMFFLQPAARWHFIFIERDSKNVYYTARKYFTGLD